MTRHIILGNGNVLVCLDKNASIREFYYPYVGQENHVSSNHHLVGVWVDGIFSWINLNEWKLDIKYKKDALVSSVVAYNDKLKVEVIFNEAVHYQKNIFLRQMTVKNKGNKKRKIKVFCRQHFHISEANIGDTVYYNPILNSIINYKGKRYFLIGGMTNGKHFDDYATGVAESSGGRFGTHIDAEDGILSKNPIEHGSVDSTIGFTLELNKNSSQIIDYWITIGERYSEVKKLRDFVIKKTCSNLISQTENYWVKWANKKKINFFHLDNRIRDLFKTSLLIVRAQTDNRGAIIAANDTHTFHFKKDTYSYMWARDGALIARSLDRVGHHDLTTEFFNFCSQVVSDEGYLFHKYRPDGSLGSSWHPWVKGNKIQLPIQEDETALVLDALWKHYSVNKNSQQMKILYKKFIKKAGDFLYEFRDKKTRLPKESYDLWEEKLGVHTFTCSTVYAGLESAKNFAKVFGKKSDAKKYEQAAKEVREATLKYLYDSEKGIFIKGIYYDYDGNMHKDKTVDVSNVYGIFEYKLLEVDDLRVQKTMDVVLEKLWCEGSCKGLARYENDRYYRPDENSSENPWFISTMWLAEYYIAKAKSVDDLKLAEDLLIWVTQRALPSGALSEQLNPLDGTTLSVAPLTWSHAGFIIAVVKYIDKFKKLNKKKNK